MILPFNSIILTALICLSLSLIWPYLNQYFYGNLLDPITIVSAIQTSNTSEFAAFAAGCFWGVENLFRENFKIPEQIVDVRVGYGNGNKSCMNPTYKLVCEGDTNFAETLLISYEPANITYEELVDFFFRIHDPTTLNRQGRSTGTQYRSGVFTFNAKQKEIALDVKDKMQKEWYPNQEITTVIEDFDNFWDAENYHQLYFGKNNTGYRCPSHYVRNQPVSFNTQSSQR
jgi:peptide-methionine (S)-S-oxide reductase